jgi:Flp pilus assembly protein TadB
MAREARRKEYERIARIMEVHLPGRPARMLRRAAYRKFLEEVRAIPTTRYEKACAIAERILPIKPSASMEMKLRESIRAAYLTVTPRGVLSLAVLVSLMLSVIGLSSVLLGFGAFAALILLLAAGAGWYLYTYPAKEARVVLMRMSADTVLAILYMVVYMRMSPTIEGALRFASENLTGPLAWDLRKLMWNIEVGVWPSADAALADYVKKWKDFNPEFAEALNMLRGAAVEPTRREMLFNETLDTILTGTRERTKHYAAGLKMPLMIIHAMGVLLPVMGLVLFPILAIFMAEVVKPVFLFVGYDILLPIALYSITGYILATKPPTFSQPDISACRGVPPLGKILIAGKSVSIWPFALLIMAPLLVVGWLGLAAPDVYISVSFSVLMILALAAGLAIYCLLDAWQKMRVRNSIEKIEGEFRTALFNLGNAIAGGAPLEVAIDRAAQELKELKIAKLFKKVSVNMREFGYTFEAALFDRRIGAIWDYPSRIITSIMRTLVETSKKSMAAAADSMLTISRYLRGVHEVKEEINELLGDTVSSMKFLAMFLAPMIAGVTVTMAVIILQILVGMGEAMAGLYVAGDIPAGAGIIPVLWAGTTGKLPISHVAFQGIVGLYMLEVSILLSMFLNRIQYGEDVVGERNLMGWTLIFAGAVYAISWIVTYGMFGSAIAELLTPI